MKRLVLICECNSLEHQVAFWYDEEDNSLYCEPHLTTQNNFFKRILVAIKYIFGYKANYGHWDSTMFKKGDLIKLREYLDSFDSEDEEKGKFIKVMLHGETLWASMLTESTAKIRNIPITSNEYELFDIVSIEREDGNYKITGFVDLNT